MLAYTKEITAPFLPLVYAATDNGVRRTQEWLTLHGFATGIDGEFGPATKAAIIAFQKANKLSDNGVVQQVTWDALIAPMVRAEREPAKKANFGATVCEIAAMHLAEKAREVGGDNRGPWVRLYGRGLDQSIVDFFPWCQAFANLPYFNVARVCKVELPFPLTDKGTQSAYVPWVAESARKAGRFAKGTEKSIIPRGSMFFVPGQRGGAHSYIHVGIVIEDNGETITTIEGNTNEAGGSNGYAVAKRFRRKSSCDYGII